MANTETILANQALGRIGALRLTDIDISVDTSKQNTQVNLYFDQTRDSLIRSHWWRFASDRIDLVSGWLTATAYTTQQYVFESSLLYKCVIAHPSGTFATDLAAVKWVLVTDRPPFQWTYRYTLPADFLRIRALHSSTTSYALEGSSILTNSNDVEMLYAKQITDVTQFDALFVEVFVLQLAIKLVMPLAQDKELRRELQDELVGVMSRVRTVDRQEQNTIGRSNMATWVDARLVGAVQKENLSGNPDDRITL